MRPRGAISPSATKELSLAEAAMLAGLVRAPSQLAPTRNLGGAKERADTVLQAMVDTGAITAEQAEAARSEPVNLRVPPETPPGTNYFVDTAASDVRRLLGGASGDLTLRTTLDLELQRLAEGVIERRLDAEGRQKNVSQAALVALAPDGAILALVGGRDYEASQFNRATQAQAPGRLAVQAVRLSRRDAEGLRAAVASSSTARPRSATGSRRTRMAASAAPSACATPSRSRSTRSRRNSPTRSASRR